MAAQLFNDMKRNFFVAALCRNPTYSDVISEMNTMTDVDDFRTQKRAWLEANCPPEMRLPMASEDDVCWGGRNWKFASDAQQIWLERVAERGWTAATWPREYGGAGLSSDEAKVLAQEMRALNCRAPLNSFGIWMLGPALLKFGSDAQKAEFMPKIARGEIRWCPGLFGAQRRLRSGSTTSTC